MRHGRKDQHPAHKNIHGDARFERQQNRKEPGDDHQHADGNRPAGHFFRHISNGRVAHFSPRGDIPPARNNCLGQRPRVPGKKEEIYTPRRSPAILFALVPNSPPGAGESSQLSPAAIHWPCDSITRAIWETPCHTIHISEQPSFTCWQRTRIKPLPCITAKKITSQPTNSHDKRWNMRRKPSSSQSRLMTNRQ